jgi:hypothetical protein
MVRIAPRFSSFQVGGPSSSARSGGAISGIGFMVPQLFTAGGNWSYQEFWAVTDGSCFARVLDPDKGSYRLYQEIYQAGYIG